MRLLAGFAIASMLSSGCIRPMFADGGSGPIRGEACAAEDPCFSGNAGNIDDIISVAVAGTILVAVTVELIRRL